LSEVQETARRAGAGIGLYHDLALGVDPWGADAWAWPEFTVPGIRVGAPADDFSPKGQNWGFAPPHGERYRQDGYRFFAAEISKNSHPGGALRIDHILKFSRLFWIPEGGSPKDGAYVKYPLEDLIRILALESVRNKSLIIGEDLGTLPDQLREVLLRYGVFSYRLFYFEKNEEGDLKDPAEYPETALASVSTHDLPPLAGFWGLDDIVLRKKLDLIPEEGQFQKAIADRIKEKRRIIDRLHQLGFLSGEEALTLQAQDEPAITDELHRAVLSFLFSSRARLAVIGQEDLFLEKRQLNLPGTIDQYPNWTARMPFSLEELWTHPQARKKTALFRELIEKYGRGWKREKKAQE
jgi:4-alpha-glucanotransferase